MASRMVDLPAPVGPVMTEDIARHQQHVDCMLPECVWQDCPGSGRIHRAASCQGACAPDASPTEVWRIFMGTTRHLVGSLHRPWRFPCQLGQQHQLAEMAAGFHAFVGKAHLRERQRLVHRHLECAGSKGRSTPRPCRL